MIEIIYKDKQRIKKFGEVFTPEWLVKDMLDLCEPDISDLSKKVLEPSCGNGNFLIGVFKCRLKIDDKITIAKYDTLAIAAISNIYGIELLRDNVTECRQRLLCCYIDKRVELFKSQPGKEMCNHFAYYLKKNIICGNFLKINEEKQYE